jgi:hypothetical protein
MTESQPYTSRSLSPAQAVLLGTLTVGVLDLIDAMVFFGLRGVTPVRILQSIAAGLLGRDAFRGGPATAALGALLHFFIAFGIVCVYYLVSRRLGILTRHPVLCGLLYGVVVFVIMNRVVIPLSAAATGQMSPPVLVNGLLIHALGVGLPSALFARAARPSY